MVEAAVDSVMSEWSVRSAKQGYAEREVRMRKHTKLGFSNDEVLLVFALAIDDLVCQELFEALAHLSFIDSRDVFDSFGGVGESVDGGKLEEVAGAFCRVERLMEVLGGLELRRVRDFEEAEAHSRLEENLDHGERM